MHLVPDGQTTPNQPGADYVRAAIAQGIEVLAITDHYSVAYVRDVIAAARERPILALPGIEVSSRDGHLLALFPPDRLDDLEGFAAPTNLDLGAPLPDGSRRSSRTMLHLLNTDSGVVRGVRRSPAGFKQRRTPSLARPRMPGIIRVASTMNTRGRTTPDPPS